MISQFLTIYKRYRQIAKLTGEDDSSDPLLLNSDVRRAIMGVEYMAKSFKEEEYYNRSRAEWKYVAFVLDQLLLYVFIGDVGYFETQE